MQCRKTWSHLVQREVTRTLALVFRVLGLAELRMSTVWPPQDAQEDSQICQNERDGVKQLLRRVWFMGSRQCFCVSLPPRYSMAFPSVCKCYLLTWTCPIWPMRVHRPTPVPSLGDGDSMLISFGLVRFLKIKRVKNKLFICPQCPEVIRGVIAPVNLSSGSGRGPR